MTDPRSALVIDDDESIRRVIEFNLQEDGYVVRTAANGADGLEVLLSQPVDVVLSDVRMPEMDGLELLARIVAMRSDVPVIMLTAHGSIDTAVEAMKLGAFDFLTKPFDRAHLKRVVAKAVDVATLRAENRYLREVVRERFSFEHMIAGSRAMRAVTDVAARVAPTEATVLLEGESGRGRNCWPRRFTSTAHGRAVPSSRSTAARSPRTCSSQNSLATARARSPAPSPTRSGSSRRPTAARSSWTRWGSCRWRSRSSCYASSRSARWIRSATHAR
jgi:DNA-binding NtrC family response regulator